MLQGEREAREGGAVGKLRLLVVDGKEGGDVSNRDVYHAPPPGYDGNQVEKDRVRPKNTKKKSFSIKRFFLMK